MEKIKLILVGLFVAALAFFKLKSKIAEGDAAKDSLKNIEKKEALTNEIKAVEKSVDDSPVDELIARANKRTE